MKTIISKSGKKIIFRLPKKDDLDVLYKYAKEIEAEDTFITLNPQEPLTYEEEKEVLKTMLKKQKELKKVDILVFDRAKMIGSCGIEKKGRRQNHVGMFGIALLKDYRSEGIGKKLANYTIALTKERLQIKQILLTCLANNQVGLSFYKSLGFTEIGCHPNANLYNGKFIDSIIFYKDL